MPDDPEISSPAPDSTTHAVTNPVTRARLMVEAEVPIERRGPGWDRHWRELEAYAAAGHDWGVPAAASSGGPSGDAGSTSPGAPVPKRRRRRRARVAPPA